MRIYLDMVSTEPPQYRGKDKSGAPWRAHAARIAMAVERDDRTASPFRPRVAIETTLLALIQPPPPGQDGSWAVELPWIARYAGRIAADDGTIDAWAVVESLAPWLAAVAQPGGLIIAHNAPFHRSVLNGLIEDGGERPRDDLEWFCTFHGANVPGMRSPVAADGLQCHDGPAGRPPDRRTAMARGRVAADQHGAGRLLGDPGMGAAGPDRPDILSPLMRRSRRRETLKFIGQQPARVQRDIRRAAALPAWPEQHRETAQRTAMLAAAFLLDEHYQEFDLADWLHLAAPDHANEVATGVAVHALLRGYSEIWDIFAATGTFDYAMASRWYDGVQEWEFVWQPRPEQLIEPPGEKKP